MAFTPKTWQDFPSTATPVTAAELNRVENGIQAAAATADSAVQPGTSPSLTGLTLSGLASGRVLVTETGGAVTSDSMFVWDAANTRLGIGTASPARRLTVNEGRTSISGSQPAVMSSAATLQDHGDTGPGSANWSACQMITSTFSAAASGTADYVSVVMRAGYFNPGNSLPAGKTLGTLTGFQTFTSQNGAGATSTVNGALTNGSISAGTINNYYGFAARSLTKTGGTITAQAGLQASMAAADAGRTTQVLLGTTTIPTGDWAIHSVATDTAGNPAPSYLSGDLRVATTVASAGYRVVVAGAVTAHGYASAVTTKTAAYTLTTSDSVVLADASSLAFTVTLPTAVGATGRQYTIVNVGATNTVTVAAPGSETISGAATQGLTVQWAFLRVVSNGANWVIIGKG